MTIRLTQDEAQTVRLMKEAIAACNALVLHVTRRQHGLHPSTVERIIEADFILNTAEDDFINDDSSCFGPSV